MRPSKPILAVALIAVAFAACITGVPVSTQTVAPLGTDRTLDCATQQLKALGYTIAAGDSRIGFVRGEKYLPTAERWLIPGTAERDVLTATVLADPETGESSLRLTAGLRNQDDAGRPTTTGISDANAIVATCTDGNATAAIPPRAP